MPPWDAVAGTSRPVDAASRRRARAAPRHPGRGGRAARRRPPHRCASTPGSPRSAHGTDAPVVIDLSALWAGPLCARLLGGRGCAVREGGARRPARRRARRPPRVLGSRSTARKEAAARSSVDELVRLLDDAPTSWSRRRAPASARAARPRPRAAVARATGLRLGRRSPATASTSDVARPGRVRRRRRGRRRARGRGGRRGRAGVRRRRAADPLAGLHAAQQPRPALLARGHGRCRRRVACATPSRLRARRPAVRSALDRGRCA